MIDPGLAHWRLQLDRLHATFRAGSFADAAAFVQRVAQTTRADVDLRPAGVVHLVVLLDDVASAEAITALAEEAGLASEPLSAATVEVAIDAVDIPAVKPFWKAVLGYTDEPDAADPGAALVDPLGQGPAVWFQQMDEPRPQHNRIHLDLAVPHDEAPRRIDAALSAGGVVPSDTDAPAF